MPIAMWRLMGNGSECCDSARSRFAFSSVCNTLVWQTDRNALPAPLAV